MIECKGKVRVVDLNGNRSETKGIIKLSEDKYNSLDILGKVQFDELSLKVFKLLGKIKGNSIIATDIYILGGANIDEIKVENTIDILYDTDIYIKSIKSLGKVEVVPNQTKNCNINFRVGKFNFIMKSSSKSINVVIDNIEAKEVILYGGDVGKIVCETIRATDTHIETLNCSGSKSLSNCVVEFQY